MSYDVFIVEGDAFDPDQAAWIKLESLSLDEISILAGVVFRQSKDMDLVIRAKKN